MRQGTGLLKITVHGRVGTLRRCRESSSSQAWNHSERLATVGLQGRRCWPPAQPTQASP